MPGIGMKIDQVLDRDGKEKGRPTGGRQRCRLEGCNGLRIGVRWPDGKLSWPCTKGMTEIEKGVWQIQ